MSISRRSFLRYTFVVGPVTMAFWSDMDAAWAQGGVECTLPNPPAPKQFIPNEPKVVQRLSAAELANPSQTTQLQQLRNAFGVVRGLPTSDVIGWSKQIAQHCLNCTTSNANNVHYNWQFLPWHRGLLYFLERILRKLSNTDDLRLAYWDWENPSSRVLPSIYAPTGQSLYWSKRGNLRGSNWPLTDTQVDVQGLLALPDFRIFGGTTTQRSPVPAAFSGPHASVHNNFAPGDMANLLYSPRDPVFYAHHSNIDRLWSSWVAAGHQSPDFGDAKVYFYDDNRVWSYVLMNDLRDETKLGYRYSTLMQPKTPVASFNTVSMARTANRFTLASEAISKLDAPGADFLVLENIQNLDKINAKSPHFGVFSDSPAAGTNSRKAKTFLGTVSRVLSEGHEHNGPLSTVLDVTVKLSGLAKNKNDMIELAIAPLDASGKTTAAAVPLVADNVSLLS